jgi:dolichol-phosphate mannosyltransferase
VQLQVAGSNSKVQWMNDLATSERLSPVRDVRRPIELAVIVPTFNEAENVRELHTRLRDVLEGVSWEMIVVDDDSTDGTQQEAQNLAEQSHDVRLIRRIGRRGLSTAVIEGMMATPARYLAVIDADLQHDETQLMQMLNMLREGDVDLVIGSRYANGGSIGNWNQHRARMSSLATKVAQKVVRADLSDPMSGFFMITREAMDRTVRSLSGEGYKILLDLFASARPPLRFVEIPYVFRPRLHGESKLDAAVVWEYLVLILDKTIGGYIPPRLLLFVFVGGTGVLVHYAAFTSVYFTGLAQFTWAQLFATVVAMTTNYAFNNILTYRDARRHGWRFLSGLLGFYAVCSVGLVGNVGVASLAFNRHYTWWLAAFAGIVVGTMWNFAASSILVWNRRRI